MHTAAKLNVLTGRWISSQNWHRQLAQSHIQLAPSESFCTYQGAPKTCLNFLINQFQKGMPQFWGLAVLPLVQQWTGLKMMNRPWFRSVFLFFPLFALARFFTDFFFKDDIFRSEKSQSLGLGKMAFKLCLRVIARREWCDRLVSKSILA